MRTPRVKKELVLPLPPAAKPFPTWAGIIHRIMPIPNVHQVLRPLLALADQRPVTRRDATPVIEEHFHLTAEERAARIPSGASTTIRHRVGWAITFLTK